MFLFFELTYYSNGVNNLIIAKKDIEPLLFIYLFNQRVKEHIKP